MHEDLSYVKPKFNNNNKRIVAYTWKSDKRSAIVHVRKKNFFFCLDRLLVITHITSLLETKWAKCLTFVYENVSQKLHRKHPQSWYIILALPSTVYRCLFLKMFSFIFSSQSFSLELTKRHCFFFLFKLRSRCSIFSVLSLRRVKVWLWRGEKVW